MNFKAVVETLHMAADGVLLITLKDPAGSAMPAWEAGAHIDVFLDPNTVRQYSLCGDPADRRRWQIAVLRQPTGRGGSEYIHRQLRTGDTVEVSVPRNNFRLQPAAAYLFIAGGIGITPILPMVRRVDAGGVPWRLVYGGRTRPGMAFLEHLAQVPGERIEIVVEQERGFPRLREELSRLTSGTGVYVCGPEPLLEAVRSAWPTESEATLHFERFSAVDVSPDEGHAFDIVIASTGATLHVGKNDSIVDVLLDYDIDILTSCREGICGSCETRVLGGIPEHHDSLLSEEERAAGDVMMVCVGRAASGPLVLDL